jgi:molybdopterin synthase catalytic subunit
VVVFRGRIRPDEQGETIAAMAYEHYAGMAEKQMAQIVDRAAVRWPLLAVAVEHRVGEVAVDDDAVVVAVGAGHRAEAFEACRWIIDEVKRVVPIWKRSDAGPGLPDPSAFATAASTIRPASEET